MNAPLKASPFDHILCWVDGSDEACRAAERAAQLARSLEARLTFLAIGKEQGHDEGFADYARIEGGSGPMPPTIENDVDGCLRQAISISTKLGFRNAAHVIATGDASTAICNAALKNEANLVVIRKGKSNLVERLMGSSVSDRLVDGCGFAVLSVG
ncbi:universal stress protein [Maritalea sp.]|uniref:universal stress protein n=1 Tax=Maritalea sp. TaxID=2003361 RepID=UPI003EF900A9